MADEPLQEIPSELPSHWRRMLERLRRTDPRLFRSSLQTALNILAREPRRFQQREWPEDAPPPDQDEHEKRHP